MSDHGWKRNAWLIWMAIFVTGTCWSMAIPFTPLFLSQELGLKAGVAAWAGVLGAVNSIGLVITSPIWGVMGDRLGRKLMMLRAGAVLSICYVFTAMVQDVWGMMVIRAAIGALSGFIPAAMALVGTVTPKEHAGKALALVSTASPIGIIVGPMVGGILADLVGLRNTLLIAAVLVGTVTFVIFLFVKERFQPQTQAQPSMVASLGEIVRIKPFTALLFTAFCYMGSQAALDPMLILYIKGLLGPGTANWTAGVLYALPGIAFGLAAHWWVVRGERWGYVTTLTVGLFLGAGFILFQAMVSSPWPFASLRMAQGLAMAAIQPALVTLIARVVPRNLQGRAYGLNHSAISMGNMLGPLTGGFLATWVGTTSVFIFAGMLLFTGALWTRYVVWPHLLKASNIKATS